jgi:soluble lytic murein transglycosylase-like protein
MAGNMGAVLTGLANGLSNVPQQLNDLAYQQQQRQQQLQAGSIANQMSALQLQQAQTAQQNQQDYQQAMVSAWQGAQDTSSQTASPPVAAGQPAAGGAPPSSGNAYGNLAPLQRAGITLAQFDTLAQQNGVPADIAYGVIASESQGNPDAVSPKGAVGSFQVMPATAAQPGFGVAPFDPKSPQGAMSYMGTMWKKAGGDPAKFAAMWNAGPGGNPNNPETQGFTKNVAKNAQAYQLSQTATQAAQQPSPADQIAARDAAGVDTPIPVYQQAIQAQGQQISMLQKVYNQAMQQGHPAVAQKVAAQISTLRDQQLDLQTKGLKIQKDANEQVASLAAGVHDQNSYNNLHEQIRNNPAMQQAVAGLNLTYDWEQDRNKVQTLADRSVTLKDQSDLRIKQAELQIKQQKEQREQAQADAPKIAAAKAQAVDDKRATQLAQNGIPFAPSIQASNPNLTPAQVQAAKKVNQTAWATFGKTDASGAQNDKAVQGFTTQMIGMLTKANPVTTGGFTRIPGLGAAWTAFENDRQMFDKAGNQMVSAAAAAAGAAGGGRSSFTAAMYDRIKTQKPSVDLNPETNLKIAAEYYAVAAQRDNMRNFLREYQQANPDSTPQEAQMHWGNYEQSLGPVGHLDENGEYHMNMAGVPKLPNGKTNDAYRDYHDFFKENPGE